MDTGSGRVLLSSCINERYGRWVYKSSILRRRERKTSSYKCTWCWMGLRLILGKGYAANFAMFITYDDTEGVHAQSWTSR